MEDQCRHRLQCAADDLRDGRQAICGDPRRAEPDRTAAPPVYPRTARDAQPDHAVRVRTVTARSRRSPDGAATLAAASSGIANAVWPGHPRISLRSIRATGTNILGTGSIV